MKKHIPNTLTSLNLAIGTYGIYFVLTVNRGYAFYFVVMAALFDFFDGFAARRLKARSDVGKQLDSLADMVSFGLLPSVFMLIWMQVPALYMVALLIGVCSAWRLAMFNIDGSPSCSFRGLPTPANAVMLTSLSFLGFELNEIWLSIICIASSLLLISNIKLMALKFEHFGWTDNEWQWGLIVGCVVLVFVFQWTFLPILVPFYIVVSVLSNVGKGKSVKT